MMLAALAKRYEMHPEVANTIFLSWCFVVITGIVPSNSLFKSSGQVELLSNQCHLKKPMTPPPTVGSTDV